MNWIETYHKIIFRNSNLFLTMNPKSFFRLSSWLFDPNVYLELFYINFRWLLVLQTWNNWCPLDRYLKFIDSKGRKDKKKDRYFKQEQKKSTSANLPVFFCDFQNDLHPSPSFTKDGPARSSGLFRLPVTHSLYILFFSSDYLNVFLSLCFII